MADEIFALSPIAARPVQPSEQDYDAIKEAFMETSRGRWFLGEYAKRNRNADTKMVLDAVARIEETIAAQKKPARDPVLDEALASFRVALAEARDAANAAVDGLAIEQNLAPVRKGARVIREIAWRLREIGADGRICDLIDSQVAAIEDAATKLNPSSLADMLSEAFDRIEGKIDTFEGSEATPASAPIAEGSTAEPDEIAPVAETELEIVAQGEAQTPDEVTAEQPAAPHVAASSDASAAQAEREAGTETTNESDIETTTAAPVAAVSPEVADQPSMAVAEAADEPKDAFDASDEAVLDLVALEMAAPDTDEAYEVELDGHQAYEEAAVQQPQLQPPQPYEPQAEKTETQEPEAQKFETQAVRESVASWEINVTFGPAAGNAIAEPAAAAALPTATPSLLEAQSQLEPERATAPSPTRSLGSSLIANGIVPRPRTSGPDPLAPIRRMSQNEKIAFFS